MKFVYDIDKIYKNLIDKYNKKMEQKSIDEEIEKDIEKEQEEIVESPENAPETQEVADPTSMESEDVHGGNESAKEIKDSPNPAENSDSESEKNIDKEINKEKDSKEDDKKLKDTKKHNTLDELRKKKRKKKNEKRRKLKRKKKIEKEKLYYAEKELETKESDNEENEKSNNSSFQSSLKFDPNKNYDEIVKKVFDDNDEKLMNLKRENIGEYLKQKVIQIIKDISLKHAGIDKNDGVETFDKKEMMTHIFKYQNYKLLNDKYDLKDARYVQFFIDTSGVYNNSSNRLLNTLIPEVIKILEMQGYECNLAACGNGFYGKDMVEDEYYGTRKTLENYKAGHVSKIACPTAETAAKMANDAEFSIVLADFDGLSSICYMANLCQKDKVPYFLSTEDRYPWDDPTMHDWVDPDLCEYDMKKVYDVSAKGNPSLDEHYYDDYEDNDNDYDDYE